VRNAMIYVRHLRLFGVQTTCLLGLLLMSAACAHSSGGRPPGDSKMGVRTALEKYFPLQIGDAWTYRGKLLGQPTEREVRLVAREAGWTIDSEGERFKLEASGLRSTSRFLLKAPLEVGTKWKAVVSMSSTENYRIEAVEVTLQVDAGRYEDCITVHSENRQDASTVLHKEDVFCPRVGLARIRTYAEIAGKGVVPAGEFQLVKFVPAPSAK